MSTEIVRLHAKRFRLRSWFDGPERELPEAPWPSAVIADLCHDHLGRLALVRVLQRLGRCHAHLLPEPHHLAEIARRAVEEGVLIVERLRPAAIPLAPPASSAGEVTSEASPTETVRHWVEIELLDEEGSPVPRMPYVLELPDGSVKRGQTDREGRARVDGITSTGSCSLNLPTLDQDLWSPL